ncbi:MBL fold metallo-hydrolase [uncultured Alteromonas sp.]|jgi:glyoxylase-like metal-dependent hydrolase (beta-lactamase superfamily II)|uniref:MBL fold metallo-hydrolase n=1 Tax=uncultured Alteromonas sp. TaxID=179113 RepID=UPI0025D468F7|nr:MBL fold metallo-hydrolase [uncultured Alteromonas sp.]
MQLHAIPGYIENIYLVEDSAGLMLLDGCSRADVETVCRYITAEIGQSLSALKLIVVTHMHPDHAGGARLLQQRSGALLACHPKAPGWYRGIAGRAAHAIDVALTWWVAGKLGKPKRHIWYTPTLQPDVRLSDEQRLPIFDDWQVIYTPGHTNHDISLLHRPSQQIYVADLIVSVKKRLTSPYPVCHPNQYKRSLERISKLQPSTVYCAHVRPLSHQDIDYPALIAQAPALPKNHWHSSKVRIYRAFGWQLNQH